MRGGSEVSTIVVYRLEHLVDEEEFLDEVVKVWVVGCALKRNGFEDYSGRLTFDDDMEPIVIGCQSAYPDQGSFEDDDSGTISDVDLKIFNELWVKLDELGKRDTSNDDVHSFISKVENPDDEDFVASEDWAPDDLLEPVAEEWNLGLRF